MLAASCSFDQNALQCGREVIVIHRYIYGCSLCWWSNGKIPPPISKHHSSWPKGYDLHVYVNRKLYAYSSAYRYEMLDFTHICLKIVQFFRLVLGRDFLAKYPAPNFTFNFIIAFSTFSLKNDAIN